MVLAVAAPAWASPPYPEGGEEGIGEPGLEIPGPRPTIGKLIDQPNLKDYRRIQERMRLLEAGKVAEANALAQEGEDRVLVILVEFAGKDEFVWQAPTVPYSYATGSMWDPLGIADPEESTGVAGDCTEIQKKIAAESGLTITDTWGMTFTFEYEGPLHNMIERPISTTDRSADSIWTDDFDPQWFEDFMFGNGVDIDYTMQSGESVYESFVGQSVRDYYDDMSSGMYTITGDVIGWVGVPHSTWYYDADQCPGARSGMSTSRGAIPGAGDSRQLVRDALDQVNAISDTIPGFDWANYDLDGDGIIDRLWIVHAGYGEEDSTALLNRDPVTGTDRTTPYPDAFYGESAVWSHSASVTPPYSMTEDIAAAAYIVMPENGGIGVFAHEYGHNLGADDLYAYDLGDTSAGFWTLMADDWTGHPIGFEPPAVDPWHLDQWGWLDPLVITDTEQEYEFTLGQASRFEESGGEYRGAKIELPDGELGLPAPVWQGDYYWWGGKESLANAGMVTDDPINVTSGMTLSFDLAHDIEGGGWDFLWVVASENPIDLTDPDASELTILTNANTQCATDPGWIGGEYGFPDDLCAAEMGGFYGQNPSWPAPDTQVFDLSALAGDDVYLGLWYMTDWATLGAGPFVDNIEVGTSAWDAETDTGWTHTAPWERSDGKMSFTHNFYLQWRNTDPESDNYDSALGEERWRFGPANSGLLVWYNNNFYKDNEIAHYLNDEFSFGPKGRMLVIDSHPDPYVNPYETPYAGGALGDEDVNLPTRGLMRDAPFSLLDTVDFTYTFPYQDYVTPTQYLGRPAMPNFHDSLGYYPGFDGPWPAGYYNTDDWDASATVPGKDSYSTKTPDRVDIPAAGGVYYYRGAGWYYANYSAPIAGGTGNPRDDNAQYGWHVEIMDQTDMTATVQVWNSTVHKQVGPAPEEITAPGDHTLTYTVSLQNVGGMDPANGAVTMTLPSVLNIVDHTAGAVQTDNVLVWEPTLNQGEWMTFTTVATVAVEVGDPYTELVAALDVFDGSTTPPEHDEWVTPVSLFDVDGEIDGVSTKQGVPGSGVMYTVAITNTGDNDDTFNVTATSDPAWPTGLGEVSSQAASTQVALASGETTDVGVFVMVPESVMPGESAVTTVDVVSQGDPRRQATFEFTTTTLYKLYLPLVAKGS
jgi:immune inhibitor A